MNQTMMPNAVSTPGIQCDPAQASPAGLRRIEEIVVCSLQGEVLYTWQCSDVEGRLKLLEAIQWKAKHLGNALILGQAHRWELDGPEGRVVACFQPNCRIWMRVSRTQPQTAV